MRNSNLILSVVLRDGGLGNAFSHKDVLDWPVMVALSRLLCFGLSDGWA